MIHLTLNIGDAECLHYLFNKEYDPLELKGKLNRRDAGCIARILQALETELHPHWSSHFEKKN